MTIRRLLLLLLATTAGLCAVAPAAHAIPSLSVENVTLDPEGTQAGPPYPVVHFVVKLSEPSAGLVSVTFGTFDNTARNPEDYQQLSGSITFQPGETEKDLPVTVIADNVDENDETFRLQLSSPDGAGIDRGTATATIVDDDGPPSLRILDGVVSNPGTEGTSGNRVMDFTVKLVDAAGNDTRSGKTVSVDFETQPGTAIPNSTQDLSNPDGDYLPKTDTVTLVPGQIARTIQIVIVGDSNDETNETFHVVVKGTPVNAGLDDGDALGTIVDDDGPTINVTDVSAAEGSAGETVTAALNVVLTAPSPQAVTFDYSTADDTARAPEDYEAVTTPQHFTIPAGALTASLPIVLHGDDLDESDERIRVNLTGAVNGTLTDPQASLTIIDDDAAPRLVVQDLTVTEGTAQTPTTAKIAVALSAPSGRLLVARYATRDGTALAGSDYETATTGLAFSVGETSKQLELKLSADAEVEEDETLLIDFTDLNDPSQVATVTVTIADDDLTPATTPNLVVGDAAVALEGDEGSRDVVFTVRLDRPLARRVLARFTTVAGSATPGRDYADTAGVVEIAAGETTTTVRVHVFGDTEVEFNEEFRIVLSDPVNANLQDATGIGVITDDDVGLESAGVGRQRIDLTQLVCRRGRSCRGLLARWSVALAGRVRVEVTAQLPKRRTLKVVSRRVSVDAGDGSVRVRLVAGRRADALLKRLRGAKVRTLHITISYTSSRGALATRAANVALT